MQVDLGSARWRMTSKGKGGIEQGGFAASVSAMQSVCRYEEEHFVRLQRKRRREDDRGVADDMKQLLNFSDVRALTDDQSLITMVPQLIVDFELHCTVYKY